MDTTLAPLLDYILWQIHVRNGDKTPPHDVRPPIKLRARSEAEALDCLAAWAPHLVVVTDEHGNPCISRQS